MQTMHMKPWGFKKSVPVFVAMLHIGALFGEAPIQEGQQGAPGFKVSQDSHAARGFGTDSARIDSQITLHIPDHEADAVYQYLLDKIVGQEHIMADRFPGIHLYGQKMSDVSLFTDRYYDTPALDLYATKNSVRHRTRVNTTNPKDRKSGRELVQVKLTPPDQFTLRNELKYEVKNGSTHDNAASSSHPLLKLISGSMRNDFKKVFTDAGLDPNSLRHIFTITQTRKRGYLNLDDQNIFSFSVDQGSASILWAKGTFSSVDCGLVEIAYTEADEAHRQKMWQIRDAIIHDLKEHFPDLTQNSDSKYSIVLAQLIEQIPALPWLIWLGIIGTEAPLVICFGLLFLLIVIFQLLRRRKKPQAHRW